MNCQKDHYQKKAWLGLLCLAAFGIACQTTMADTKGLNQVVTPKIQPLNTYSFSLQYQHPGFGDIYMAQLEFGITKTAEAAIWQSAQYDTLTLAVEQQFYKSHGFQVSGGTFWFDHTYLPFAVAGYRKGPAFGEVGIQDSANNKELILGASYDINSEVSFLTDFISGPGNALTFGFNLTLNKNLSCNPALYYMNDTHKLLPYFVVTWASG